jgi:ABC-type multidrug transport system ATPase subunit
MTIKDRDNAFAKLMEMADKVAELERKKLELENEGDPLREDYEEMEYEATLDVEKAGDAKSKALYADPYRKEQEIDHRLRIDPKAKELAARLDKIEYEVDKINIELDKLESQKRVLEGIAGVLFPEFGEEDEEDEEDEDTP